MTASRPRRVGQSPKTRQTLFESRFRLRYLPDQPAPMVQPAPGRNAWSRGQNLSQMKSVIHTARALLAGWLCCAAAGCQSHRSTLDLGGGYEAIRHPVHSLLPTETPARISLSHVDDQQRTVPVWPGLFCTEAAVHDDIAIFVAYRGFVHQGQASLHPRLFAVRSPAPPLDITEEVLWRWAAANHRDIAKTFGRFNLALPAAAGGNLVARLEFWPGSYLSDADWPDTGEITLDWTTVANLMQSVKAKGVVQRDPRWHTRFIGEAF